MLPGLIFNNRNIKMILKSEQITDFSKESIKLAVNTMLNTFNMLTEADKLAMFNFLIFAGSDADVFTTKCPFLLENRNYLLQNLKNKRILSLNEMKKELLHDPGIQKV
jgi:hypothetical protein